MLRTAITSVALAILQLAAVVNSAVAADAALSTAVERVAAPRILVIAHRGDSKVAPENTLPAFASAVDAGSDLVELDYLHSADGVPVVFHDKDLDRTTNARALWGGMKIELSTKTLAELRMLDAGAWFDQKFAGTPIPTLGEALDTIQAGSMTLIERKGGDPATCVKLIKRRGLLDRVVVQSFDWDYLEGCRELSDKLVIAALGHQEFTTEKLDDIARTGARVIAWQNKYTTASTIQAIHDRGYKAWVWTVDDPQRVSELVQAKIDGIITNRPANTRAAIRAALVPK
jgi:glycerophosphoryl diester phosphodiesterase